MAETYTDITLKNLDNAALKQIKIGANVYQIKDSRVDTLVIDVNTKLSGINSRVNTLEGKTWTAVTKDGTQGAYATSVTQDANGQIAVTYSNVRSDNLTAGVTSPDGNGSSYTKVITGISQNTDGSITANSVESGQLTAYDGSTTNTLENVLKEHRNKFTTVIEDAQTYTKNAIKGVIGAQGDAATANTIYGAKKYAEEQAAGAQTAAIQAAYDRVDALAGQQWTENAITVKNIIDELTGADTDATKAMITVADKLRGDFTIGEGTAATKDVLSYINAKDEEIKASIANKNVTAKGETGDSALVNASASGNKVTVESTKKLQKAVGYAESALQTITGESGDTALISVSQSGTTATVTSSSDLQTAVTAAKEALPANRVANTGTITYFTPTYANEQLEFTQSTLSNIVVSTDKWPTPTPTPNH